MRDIKFRGLDVFTGEWVFGSHIQTGTGAHYIIPQNLFANTLYQTRVDKDSVSQLTGLKDKNGKEIYEGDIVNQEFNDERPLEIGSFIGVVEQSEGAWWIDNGVNHAERLWSELNVNEVLGNIYENQESLETQE